LGAIRVTTKARIYVGEYLRYKGLCARNVVQSLLYETNVTILF